MNISQAKELLSYHSGRNNNIDNPKWRSGFLGCLCPFQGQLYEDNFKDIMECLTILANEFGNPQVDKNMVADVLSIIRYTEWWIEPGGMLTKNHLLTLEQESMLREWIDIIFDAVVNLLDGSVGEAFMEYTEYLEKQK